MTSSARALQAAFAQLRDYDSTSTEAWADLLGSEYGSVEFVAKHCGVLGLLGDLPPIISALPATTRERSERYLPDWWEAVVLPLERWSSSNRRARDMISQVALDQLGSLADVVELFLGGGPLCPMGPLDRLRGACIEWIEMVSQGDAISESHRTELLAQLRHVVWLIDNESLFGSARAVTAGNALLVSLSEKGEAVQFPTWRRKLVNLGAALAIATGTLSIASGSLQEATKLVTSVDQLYGEVKQLISGDPSDVSQDEAPNSSVNETESIGEEDG